MSIYAEESRELLRQRFEKLPKRRLQFVLLNEDFIEAYNVGLEEEKKLNMREKIIPLPIIHSKRLAKELISLDIMFIWGAKPNDEEVNEEVNEEETDEEFNQAVAFFNIEDDYNHSELEDAYKKALRMQNRELAHKYYDYLKPLAFPDFA